MLRMWDYVRCERASVFYCLWVRIMINSTLNVMVVGCKEYMNVSHTYSQTYFFISPCRCSPHHSTFCYDYWTVKNKKIKMARRRFLLYKVVDISITGIMLFCICRCSFTGNSIKQMNHWTDGSRPETRTNWDNLIISGSIFHPVILLSVHLILCSIPSHPFSDHSPWREKGKVPGTEKCFKMAEQKSPHTVQCTGEPIPELTTMNLQYTAAQQVDDNLYQSD